MIPAALVQVTMTKEIPKLRVKMDRITIVTVKLTSPVIKAVQAKVILVREATEIAKKKEFA